MHIVKRISVTLSVLVIAAATAEEAPPSWYEPMKKINAQFDGNPCYVAQFGDSITYSMAFWSAFDYTDPVPFLKDDGYPKVPEGKRWRDIIKGSRQKGPDQGNYSGWTVGQVLAAAGAVLKRKKPEAAIIMVGTNDALGNSAPAGYREGLEKLIQMCLDAKCIPILNTIPPLRNCMKGVEDINTIIRETAAKFNVPLVDYYSEIMKRQPGNAWDGTLIGQDGVHPSGGKADDFSDENLKISGYALRSWLNFLMFRQLYFRILSTPKPLSEKVGTVEKIRDGIRCPVIGDTKVSAHQDANDNERVWNWGKARV